MFSCTQQHLDVGCRESAEGWRALISASGRYLVSVNSREDVRQAAGKALRAEMGSTLPWVGLEGERSAVDGRERRGSGLVLNSLPTSIHIRLEGPEGST